MLDCFPLFLHFLASLNLFFGTQGRHAAAAAKSLQLRPTLCDPIDGRPTGSPVPGILQARTLEWGAIAFSAGKAQEAKYSLSTRGRWWTWGGVVVGVCPKKASYGPAVLTGEESRQRSVKYIIQVDTIIKWRR